MLCDADEIMITIQKAEVYPPLFFTVSYLIKNTTTEQMKTKNAFWFFPHSPFRSLREKNIPMPRHTNPRQTHIPPTGVLSALLKNNIPAINSAVAKRERTVEITAYFFKPITSIRCYLCLYYITFMQAFQ